MSTRPISLSVSGPQHGMPLLDFLVRRLSLSSNKAKALLDDRLVFVNGRRVWMACHPLAIGDKLQIMRPVADPARPAGHRALGRRASRHLRTDFSARAVGLLYTARLEELAKA